jgi:hypothetical protein
MQTRCPVDGADGGQCLARDVGRELLDVSPAGGDEGGDAGADRGPTRVDGDPLHGLLDDVDGPRLVFYSCSWPSTGCARSR